MSILPPSAPRSTLRVALHAALALAAVLSAVAASARAPVAMPGPAPQSSARRFDPVAENARCEQCHADVAAEQRASFHARSHADVVYQRALAREPMAFCRGCHAPEEQAAQRETTDRASLGVACVTCHLTGPLEQGVLAAPLAAGQTAGSAPHAVLRDAAFAGDGACGRCHQFVFPTALGRDPFPLLMQSTLNEHAHSPEHDAPCASCHMPSAATALRPRGRHHGFRGGHDAAFVRDALAVHIERTGPLSARVTLEPRHVGHAFPTGDLFRRLEISAEAVGPDQAVITARTRHLTRHFVDRRSGAGSTRVLAGDDRPDGNPVRIDLTLDEKARGWPLAVRVAYQRVEHPRDDDDDAEVAGEIELGVRVLPP